MDQNTTVEHKEAPQLRSRHRARLDALGGSVSTVLEPLPTVLGTAPVSLRQPERAPDTRPDKVLRDLAEVFDHFAIADGQTLSFHHHYRNGDRLISAVLAFAAARGLTGLTIAPSSIFPTHADLVPLIKDGTITAIVTDYMRGPVADAIAEGHLAELAILQSHGGRARAIAVGQLNIDVAFVAAPLAHVGGETTGRGGAFACGPLGYPAVDAAFAKHTVVMADEVVTHALPFVDIPGGFVDAVVHCETPGDTSGIESGATVASLSPSAQHIGTLVAQCIEASGHLQDGMSLQSGAGGYSLGAVGNIGARMKALGIQGSFISGGINRIHVDLLESGVFREIRDVQCFDRVAVQSAQDDPRHHMMTAEEYASPIHPDAVVNGLSVMLLGAVEVDAGFNVNVVSGGDGRILGGPGGHPDTAAGAQLRIVTTELTGGGYAKLVEEVSTVSTPGHDVDLIVTDQGVAVHPDRAALRDQLVAFGVEVLPFEVLRKRAEVLATRQKAPARTSPTILIEARDGRVLDWA